MLGNDTRSDCTIAGAMHCEMLWNKIASSTVHFTELDALDDYRDACGYVFGDENSDNGGNMVDVAKYWQQTGMRDCTARRHKIAAYMSVSANNLDHIYAAAFLFGAVGLGVMIQSSSEAQFDANEPWDVVAGDVGEGYHYVPLVGRDEHGLCHVVTWGRDQAATEAWIKNNVKEVVAVISQESMVNGKTLEGFSYEQLQSDLAAL